MALRSPRRRPRLCTGTLALVLGACAGAPPPEAEPELPPSPPLIAIPAQPPPQAGNVAVDAGLLGLVVASAHPEEPTAVRLRLIGPSAPSSSMGEGTLEVAPSTDWVDRARASANADEDPAPALLAQLNGSGPVSLDELQPVDVGEGYALVLRARAERLDFATGVGIRYLAAYTDDYAPLTDGNLFYVFEGLTRDGHYHVQMLLPVKSAVLPDEAEPGTLETAVEFAGISDAYVAAMTERLERAASQGFRPSLERLDAFARSIAVR